MQKILVLIKNHKVLSSVVVLAIGLGLVWYFRSQSSTAQAQYATQAAEKGTVSVSVSASGQISAETQLDLKPGNAGSLTSVYVKAGDQVKAGQVLAIVDQSSNNVSIAQAKAALMNAQADYDVLVAGLTGSGLTAAQKTVSDAEKAVEKAEKDLEKSKRDYETVKSEQLLAVERAENKLLNSGLEAVPDDLLSSAELSVEGTYNGTAEGSYSITMYITGNGTYYRSYGLGNESGQLKRGYDLPIGNGLSINFSTSGTLNVESTYKIEVPNKASSEYFTNLNSYQDALLNQTKALQSAQDDIDLAEDAVITAQENLADARVSFAEDIAPAEDTEVASAKAAILSAQAQLASASNSYNNNILKAPFDGVVAVLNNKKGDQVTTGSVVATVITKQQIASVTLNEVDAAKVKVGQKAALTFDALDDLELTGQVVEVGSIGAVSQGVVSYNVKIGLDAQDERIKPGMSLTANIITEVKINVLAVPSSAVKTGSSGKYVQVLDASGQPQNKNVEAGISSDTMTEIISGLEAGETVVTQIITSSQSSATTRTNSTTGIPGLGGSSLGGNRGAGQTQSFIQVR